MPMYSLKYEHFEPELVPPDIKDFDNALRMLSIAVFEKISTIRSKADAASIPHADAVLKSTHLFLILIFLLRKFF